MVVKSGVWENGKRIKWLSEGSVNQVNSNNFASELASVFKEPGSIEALPSDASFKKPEGWDEGMKEITEVLDVPLENIGTPTDGNDAN